MREYVVVVGKTGMAVGATLAALALAALGAPAQAQQNLGHFYMARQQIDILDDAPVVNDRRTQPAPPGQQQSGALPNRPIPLPRAGWQSYSPAPSLPSMQNSLPKTFNGVPPKAPSPTFVDPRMAKAGRYKPGSAKTAAKPGSGAPARPAVAKTYAPYQGYGGGHTPSAAPPGTGVAAGGGASTHVQGSLLHWSRTR